MFRIEFTVKTSVVYKYTMLATAGIIVWAFLNQISKLNYVGAISIALLITLNKLQYLRLGLSIAGVACIFDFLYLVFHSSNSNWFYIRCIEFMVHGTAFVYELCWITFVYCYLKQEETILSNKSKLNVIKEELGKMVTSVFKKDKPKTPEASSKPTTSTVVETENMPSALDAENKTKTPSMTSIIDDETNQLDQPKVSDAPDQLDQPDQPRQRDQSDEPST